MVLHIEVKETNIIQSSAKKDLLKFDIMRDILKNTDPTIGLDVK